MKAQSAFSLVEIMVVIAIMATLSVSAALSFSLVNSRHLEIQARKLAGDLCRIRERAVAEHRVFILNFNPDRSYSIYRDSIAAGNFMERKSLDLGSIVVNPAPASVQFIFPQGTSESKQITLAYKGRTRQVTVFAQTGFVKWQ